MKYKMTIQRHPIAKLGFKDIEHRLYKRCLGLLWIPVYYVFDMVELSIERVIIDYKEQQKFFKTKTYYKEIE